MQLNRTRVTVWQPQDWEAQAEVYIPFEVRDLETVGRIPVLIQDYIDQMSAQLSNYGEDAKAWGVWDILYKYKPVASGVGEMIPPFSGHATVAGSQHFVTFDRRFYEFDGECSYVLARDSNLLLPRCKKISRKLKAVLKN